MGISYDDSIVELVSTGIGLPGHPVPTLAVGLATALNGQRFFIGATTSEVTSVVVTSKNGTTVRVPTLPHVLKNHSVFVLSLGVVHGVCDDLCQGKIGVSFFHDAKSLPFSLPGCGVRFADGGCDGYIGTTIPLGLK